MFRQGNIDVESLSGTRDLAGDHERSVSNHHQAEVREAVGLVGGKSKSRLQLDRATLLSSSEGDGHAAMVSSAPAHFP